MHSWSARLLPSAWEPSSTSRSPRRQQQGDTTHLHSPQPSSIPGLQQLPVQRASFSTAPSQDGSRSGPSISYRFPSILKGVKKEERRGPGEPGATTPDSNDAVHEALGHVNSGTRPSKGVHKGSSQSMDTDLTTGRCMTCDSLVRWPKALKVFRCTICLMINDLKPIATPCIESGPVNAPPSQMDASAGLPANEKGGQWLAKGCLRTLITYEADNILSLRRAQAIVDDCVVSYLRARLDITVANTTCVSNFLPQSAGESSPQGGNSDLTGTQNQAPSEVSRSAPAANVPKNLPPISAIEEHGRSATAQSDRGEVSRTTDVRANDSSAGHEQWSRSPTSHRRPQTLHSPPHGLIATEGVSDRPWKIKPRRVDSIFKPLEDYIATSLGTFACINASFSIPRPPTPVRSVSDGSPMAPSARVTDETPHSEEASISGVDAKTLLLGDFAENGSWWTGGRPRRNHFQRVDHGRSSSRSLNMPAIDWAELDCFYQTVIQAGSSWELTLERLLKSQTESELLLTSTSKGVHEQLRGIVSDLAEARAHVQRALLKATEAILKRPGRPLKNPKDCRFLLILLANPLLHSTRADDGKDRGPSEARVAGPGQRSSIVKRIVGLLANLPNECHYYLVAWFSRFSDSQFGRLVDLVGSFVTYRLTRQHGGKRSSSQVPTTELIPSFPGLGIGSSAQLHAALGIARPSSKTGEGKNQTAIYSEDWQLKAAARVMSLLFSANINRGTRRARVANIGGSPNMGSTAHQRPHTHSQMLPESDFYNTLLDYSDIITDFEAWESRRGQFTFCQYPFFYSIWAKIHILEYDARRQMEVKAREAFFHSIMGRKAISQYLVLKIRRDCLVEDSLRGISENVSSGQEDIKKSLKIVFLGEEGVDAGGLRKEWFLLLVREVFDPHHGVCRRA